MDPGPVVEQRRGQRQVEAAKHQIGHAQVNDKHRRRVPHLFLGFGKLKTNKTENEISISFSDPPWPRSDFYIESGYLKFLSCIYQF